MRARTPSRAANLARPTAVLAWAMAAVLAGAVVWWAVAAIGSEQGAAPTVYTQAEVDRLADQTRALGATATPSGRSSPVGPSATPTAGPAVVPDPLASPTAAPTTSGTPSSTSAPIKPSVTVPPVAPPATPAEPAPTVVARTWNVAGGQVSAECRGTAIVLLSATPENAWSVEVKHSGPTEIEVKFRRGEEETSVHASCVAGVPEITAEAENEHD